MHAASLKKLYESVLQQILRSPVARGGDRRQIRYMLRHSRQMAPGTLCEGDHARIWIWSDLHLEHTKTIETFGRPSRRPTR